MATRALVRHDDELFYLEAALRPGDREDSGTRVRSITAEELAGIEPGAKGKAGAIELEEFDVVVLTNVPALTAERVGVLARWVRRGGGIVVAPGDRVHPEAYGRTRLSLLPQSCAVRSTPRGARPRRTATAALSGS